MEKRTRCWGRPILILSLSLFLFVSSSSAQDEEDFSCHVGGGLIFKGDPLNRAAIIPRGDINVKLDNGSVEVLCRFNSSLLNATDIYFTTKEGPIDYQIYNASTIRAEISHSKAARYTLYCKRKRKNKDDKKLCSQIVKAGYDPLDITNLTCIANDNLVLNCTWKIPANPVTTTYGIPKYSVEKFQNEVDCPKTNDPPYTSCFWGKSERFLLRDAVTMRISAKNDFRERNFSHVINIPEYVYPDKVAAHVTLFDPPLKAKVWWNLTYPIDVLEQGLWHKVEYRLAGTQSWINVTYFFHVNPSTTLVTQRMFSVEVNLPYANVDYEFRVRIHSGYEGRMKNLWSPFDILPIKSGPKRPDVAPRTSGSTFEIVEVLDSRDIYINFQDLDPLDYAGDDFHYDVRVFSGDNSQPLPIRPSEMTKSYIKFISMTYDQYRFEIFAANREGPSDRYSEVVVPRSDCLPKKTELFTVITKSNDPESKNGGRTYRLYWVPSREANELCPNSPSETINSYTIFWCRKTNGNRCRTKLFWQEVNRPDLIVKDLTRLTTADITLYEKNLTDLTTNEIFSFGLAANSGQYSSGIRWATCIVDETEPPAAPVTDVNYVTDLLSSAIIKWDLKCDSLSAVPLGFNVSYCKSTTPDFGHCTSPVEHKVINSPSAKNTTIQNLDPGHTYIFSVAILSLIGEGRQSVPKIMTLGDEIPTGPPTNLSFISPSSTSLELSWNPPSELNRKGQISEYRIQTEPRTRTISVDAAGKTGPKKWKHYLQGLQPHTKYNITMFACTKVGCAHRFPAEVSVTTKSGVPSMVKDFEIDVYNWRLSWSRNRCSSINCSYELKIIFNGTELKTVSVKATDKLFDLSDVGLTCNDSVMSFKIRERGVDENGRLLTGNWTTVKKEADLDCPGFLPWWIILIIVTVAFILSIGLIYVFRFGYGNIRQMIKDCYKNINLPKGIQAAETGKEIRRREFSPDRNSFIGHRISEPSLLLLNPDNSPVNTFSFPRDDNNRIISKLNRNSASSEEMNLIDVLEADRHGRNLSGSSDRSSGHDSAIVSSPSVGDTDPDAISTELRSNQETILRLRSSVPPYVQQGMIIEKVSEGYVTALSVPSLPHLYQDSFHASQQSTPNLNNVQLSGWPSNACRRASTGYISMPDSESQMFESPAIRKDTTEQPPIINSGHVPAYSRHFNPKLTPEFKNIKMGAVGYVTITDSPPTSGYVTAARVPSLKRPPSLPLIVGGETLPLGAYCKVASRENATASPGYVSAGPTDNDSAPILNRGGTVSPPNPYVTCGEAALISATAATPYVELSDAERWAHPIQHQPRPPIGMSSAPAATDTARIGRRTGQLPRPNTTEAAIGHRPTNVEEHQRRTPSLSKQSSGYVSQETIFHPHQYDAMVMSPKRLLASQVASGGAALPPAHSVLMSPGHQASMV